MPRHIKPRATPATARTATGPPHLLHALVTDHRTALLTYAEMLTNDRHSAEDIVQETFIRAWPHAERLSRTEGSVRGWLLTVVRNIAIDRRRSAYARHETIASDQHDVLQPDHADAVTTSVAAVGYLRKLSPEHREVLVHTYLYDRTFQETARVLGVPVGTVKSRQHYALNNLRFMVRGGRSRSISLDVSGFDNSDTAQDGLEAAS